MRKFTKILAIFQTSILCMGGLSLPANATEETAFTLSHTFGSDMVLQRDAEIPIWGWSSHKGAKITLEFKGTTAWAIVDENGEWLIKAPAQPAAKEGAPLKLSSNVDSYTITLENVLVGDVYMLSGQSNMELSPNQIKSAYPDMAQNMDSTSFVRCFEQDRNYAAANAATMATPQKDVINTAWQWRKEGAGIMTFSALGYFFASEVSKTTGIPVGVIDAASNGSGIAQFMPAELAQSKSLSGSDTVPAGGMYNALMSPFQKMSIKGFLFYQGENDQSNYIKYADLLQSYVSEMRKRFNNNFTFYNVQLSSHGGDGLTKWPNIQNLRFAQFEAYTKMENTFLTVSMDWGYKDGDPDFAHPLYKKPVAQRLAKVVLAKEYKIGDLNYSQSPIPQYAYKTEGGIAVKFAYVGDGLKTAGTSSSLQGLRIMTGITSYKDGLITEIISKDTVLLKYTSSDALGVAYATELIAVPESTEGKYIANLTNSEGLPAPAFKLTKILPADPALSTVPPPSVTPTPFDSGNGSPAPDSTPAVSTPNSNTIPYILGGTLLVALCAGAFILIKKRNNNNK